MTEERGTRAFGLQGALWGLVWLVVATVIWVSHRSRGRSLDRRSKLVFLAVLVLLCMVVTISQLMWRRFGIGVGAAEPLPPALWAIGPGSEDLS